MIRSVSFASTSWTSRTGVMVFSCFRLDCSNDWMNTADLRLFRPLPVQDPHEPALEGRLRVWWKVRCFVSG